MEGLAYRSQSPHLKFHSGTSRLGLAMADCRSLVERLRASSPGFPASRHRQRQRPRTRRATSSTTSQRRRLPGLASLCDRSPMAALDALALLAVVAALAFLAAPYARLLAAGVAELVRRPWEEEDYPYAVLVACAGAAAAAAAAVVGLVVWDEVRHCARSCGRPRCLGLRRPVEFDIQLETECVRGRALPAAPRPAEIDSAHSELEAELRKMAPTNGRAVLVFRALNVKKFAESRS